MIEILVVLGIILVLAALAVTVIQGIAAQGVRNQTRVTLGNAASMLAEFDVKTGLRRQPAHMWLPNGSNHVPTAAVPIDVWRDTDPNTAGQQGLASPGDVNPYPATETNPLRRQRTDSVAVKNTQVVLATLATLPQNKTVLAQLPQDQTITLPPNIPATPTNEATAPVMLDGWGNPIIFVPASGLRGVFLGGDGTTAPAEYVITTAKPFVPADLPNGTLAPGARPFFASAGADGVFGQGPGNDGIVGNADDTGGDDNVYSFEN